MKSYPGIILSALLAIGGCNQVPDNISAVRTDSIQSAVTPADSTALTSPAHDPDPTDSISVGQYSILSSSEETAAIVRHSLEQMYAGELSKGLIDSASRRFIFFEYDLNGDSLDEIFVGHTGPYFCGSGGCTVLLLDAKGKLLNRFTVVEFPIVIDEKASQGWQNLYIRSGGAYHLASYNGKKYPSNASILPVSSHAPGEALPRALNFSQEPYPWFRY